MPTSSTAPRLKERSLVTARKRQQQTDSALTIRDVWIEGIAPIPLNPISIYERNINILLGLFLATSVGIFFGVYPASKAAKLDPVVALRAEM